MVSPDFETFDELRVVSASTRACKCFAIDGFTRFAVFVLDPSYV